MGRLVLEEGEAHFKDGMAHLEDGKAVPKNRLALRLVAIEAMVL
jgi:hypothetical protein